MFWTYIQTTTTANAVLIHNSTISLFQRLPKHFWFWANVKAIHAFGAIFAANSSNAQQAFSAYHAIGSPQWT
jgi:hypothetical protein